MGEGHPKERMSGERCSLYSSTGFVFAAACFETKYRNGTFHRKGCVIWSSGICGLAEMLWLKLVQLFFRVSFALVVILGRSHNCIRVEFSSL